MTEPTCETCPAKDQKIADLEGRLKVAEDIVEIVKPLPGIIHDTRHRNSSVSDEGERRLWRIVSRLQAAFRCPVCSGSGVESSPPGFFEYVTVPCECQKNQAPSPQ